jgi:curved DNA-binding protein CbpA
MKLSLALEIFEIQNLDGQSEITLKKIYYQKAGIFHPDKGGNNDLFIELREAYSTLKKALKEPEKTEKNYEIDYKIAYENLQKTVIHYENIFGNQILTINQVANKINVLITSYNKNQETSKKILEESLEKLEKLEKLYTQNWFQYALNIKNISEEDYYKQYNKLVTNYNQKQLLREKEFNFAILEIYKSGNTQIIELLNQY